MRNVASALRIHSPSRKPGRAVTNDGFTQGRDIVAKAAKFERNLVGVTLHRSVLVHGMSHFF
jgi:hypothetical protein